MPTILRRGRRRASGSRGACMACPDRLETCPTGRVPRAGYYRRMPPRVPLSTVAWVFLRLGATAFGGPAAHVGLMEDEIVRRRGWLTKPDFLDLLGAAHLIPGPTSTELALHIGRPPAGWPGLPAPGAALILPAAPPAPRLARADPATAPLRPAPQALPGAK